MGEVLECDDKGHWYEAEVKEVDNSTRTQRVKLHFRGWSVRYDDWLPVDSPRASPAPARAPSSCLVDDCKRLACDQSALLWGGLCAGSWGRHAVLQCE